MGWVAWLWALPRRPMIAWCAFNDALLHLTLMVAGPSQTEGSNLDDYRVALTEDVGRSVGAREAGERDRPFAPVRHGAGHGVHVFFCGMAPRPFFGFIPILKSGLSASLNGLPVPKHVPKI